MAHQLRPTACIKCGSARSFGYLQKLTTSGLTDLLSQFSVTIPIETQKTLLLDIDIWRCKTDGSKHYRTCQSNAYSAPWFLELKEKYRNHFQHRYETRSHVDSIPEPEPNVESPRPPSVVTPSDPFLDHSVCFLDKTFFENFRCRTCGDWLQMKNLICFKVDNLWGSVKVMCQECNAETHLTTVKSPKETKTRYLSATDTVGIMCSNAEKLFLCNNLIVPAYHDSTAKKFDDIQQAALKVATISTDKALREEAALNTAGISVRGDFGWHQRANMNTQTGKTFKFPSQIHKPII